MRRPRRKTKSNSRPKPKRIVRARQRKTNSFTARAYRGELLYADMEEVIEVSRFIVREDQISFDMVTTWGLGDRWAFSAVASQRLDRTYQVSNAVGRQQVGSRGESESVPCTILIRVERLSDRHARISGTWFVRGEAYAFGGTLKRLSAKQG